MDLKIWGTRGSVPVPGDDTKRYGGNTPCLEINSGNDDALIIDAGTGIRLLGNKLIKSEKKKIHIFLSHTHWDHIQGLPFFAPLYQSDFEVDVFSFSDNGYGLDHFIDAQMRPEFFPVNKAVFKAKVNYKKLIKDKIIKLDSLHVSNIQANHSRGTLAFRIDQNNHSIVYMTDNEIKYNAESEAPNLDSVAMHNKQLINFCRGCDYLIHDSMYLLDDFEGKIGWGHSNNAAAAYFSILADVKNLVLFHYNPDYSDSKIDFLLNETKNIFRDNNTDINCLASYEGMEIKV